MAHKRKGSPGANRGHHLTQPTSHLRVTDLAAHRCWTWRAEHLCGCLSPGDCILAEPPKFHEQDQDPWRQHLAPTGAGGA